MNKKYIFSLVSVIVFSLTTVQVVLLLLDPLRARSIGLTDTLAIILVFTNFACLALSLVAFYWQRAHRKLPARDAAKTLEVYAKEQLRPAVRPEARIVPAELFQELSTPYQIVTTSLHDHPSLQEVRIDDTIKLTSVASPGQYVIAEVVGLGEDEVTLRSTS